MDHRQGFDLNPFGVSKRSKNHCLWKYFPTFRGTRVYQWTVIDIVKVDSRHCVFEKGSYNKKIWELFYDRPPFCRRVTVPE